MRILGLETKNDCGRIVVTMATNGRKITIEIELAPTTAADNVDLTKLAEAVSDHLNHPGEQAEEKRLAGLYREHLAEKERQRLEQLHAEWLDKPVEELRLSTRSAKCLSGFYKPENECAYIGELVQRSEGDMLKTKNFGRKSLKEVRAALAEMGLSLGMEDEVRCLGWTPEGAAQRNAARATQPKGDENPPL